MTTITATEKSFKTRYQESKSTAVGKLSVGGKSSTCSSCGLWGLGVRRAWVRVPLLASHLLCDGRHCA